VGLPRLIYTVYLDYGRLSLGAFYITELIEDLGIQNGDVRQSYVELMNIQEQFIDNSNIY